jgi:phosphate/sulfate permease
MEVPPLFAYFLAFYMMFAISGDNAASTMSAAVGSGVRSLREAIVIIAVFGILGALLQGSAVHETLGGGIIGSIPAYAGIAILITTAVWGSGLLLGFIPVSSAYAVVGASIGAGIYLNASLNWYLIAVVALGWIISPFAAFGITLFIAWFIVPSLRLKLKSPLRIYRFLSFLITAGACFQAYTFGANRIGFVTGPLAQTVSIDPTALFIVAILGMILGPVIVGRRFINVLGRDITHLDAGQGFSTTIGSATSDYALTLLGIPSSFDATTFGGVLGAGSSRGLSTLKTRIIRRMTLVWVSTITVSALTGYVLSSVLHGVGV